MHTWRPAHTHNVLDIFNKNWLHILMSVLLHLHCLFKQSSMTQHYDNMLTQHKITEHPLSYTNSQISRNCSTSAIARCQAAFLRSLDSRLMHLLGKTQSIPNPTYWGVVYASYNVGGVTTMDLLISLNSKHQINN